MDSTIGAIESEACTVALLSVMVTLDSGLHFCDSLNRKLSFTYFDA